MEQPRTVQSRTEQSRTDSLTQFQWQLLEIRTEIESRKLEGTLGEEQELAIVMDALALIQHIHADAADLEHAQSLFWESAGLPLGERVATLWSAIDVFVQ